MTADTLERKLGLPFQHEYRPRHLRPPSAREVRSPRPDMAMDRQIVFLLLLVVITVHAFNIAGWPAFFDDEGTYLSQAWATYDGDLTPYTYWYDHPPVGWIGVAALSWLPALFLSGPELIAGRVTMLVFTAAAVVLIYGIGKRLDWNCAFAAAAALLWGLSPLVIFEHRQVLLDVIAVPWLLGAIFLTLTPRKRLSHFLGAGFCLAIAILTKETLAILAPAVFLSMWMHAPKETRAFCVSAFTSVLILTGSLYLLFAFLKGELIPSDDHVSVIGSLQYQAAGRSGTGSVLDDGSRTREIVALWMRHDNVLIIGGAAAALPSLLVRNLRPFAVALLLSMSMTLRAGYIPFMFVTTFLPFAAIVITGLLAVVWRTGTQLRYRHALPPRQRWEGYALRGATVFVIGAALASFVPAWSDKIGTALTADVNDGHSPAVAWMSANLDRSETLVADNNYWLDLQQAGWTDPWTGVVWFWKIDLDWMTRKERLPDGWRSLDYLVWSYSMREAVMYNELPIIEQAYTNSSVVATFMSGTKDEVEIRKVNTPVEGRVVKDAPTSNRADIFAPDPSVPRPVPQQDGLVLLRTPTS